MKLVLAVLAVSSAVSAQTNSRDYGEGALSGGTLNTLSDAEEICKNVTVEVREDNLCDGRPTATTLAYMGVPLSGQVTVALESGDCTNEIVFENGLSTGHVLSDPCSDNWTLDCGGNKFDAKTSITIKDATGNALQNVVGHTSCSQVYYVNWYVPNDNEKGKFLEDFLIVDFKTIEDTLFGKDNGVDHSGASECADDTKSGGSGNLGGGGGDSSTATTKTKSKNKKRLLRGVDLKYGSDGPSNTVQQRRRSLGKNKNKPSSTNNEATTPEPVDVEICFQGTVEVKSGGGGLVPTGPTANDDYGTTPQDVPITIDVDDNDSPSEGATLDPTTVKITAEAGNGQCIANDDGSVTYTPSEAFIGTDSCAYEICEQEGPKQCDEATVFITVTPAGPNPPVAVDDERVTQKNIQISFNVTKNDYDPDGDLDPATAVRLNDTMHGIIQNVLNKPGVFEYTPDLDYEGTDAFEYRVCDSSGPLGRCATATVTITIEAGESDSQSLNAVATNGSGDEEREVGEFFTINGAKKGYAYNLNVISNSASTLIKVVTAISPFYCDGFTPYYTTNVTTTTLSFLTPNGLGFKTVQSKFTRTEVFPADGTAKDTTTETETMFNDVDLEAGTQQLFYPPQVTDLGVIERFAGGEYELLQAPQTECGRRLRRGSNDNAEGQPLLRQLSRRILQKEKN